MEKYSKEKDIQESMDKINLLLYIIDEFKY